MKAVGLWLVVAFAVAPIVAAADFEVATETLELTFSESGALISATTCFPRCNETAKPELSSRRMRIGGRGTVLLDHGLTRGVWTLTPSLRGTGRMLVFEHESGARVTWKIPKEGYRLELETGGTTDWPGMSVNSGADFRPRPLAGFGGWIERIRYVGLPARSSDFDGARAALDEAEVGTWHTDGWVGFRNRYWSFMLRADRPVDVEPRTGEGRNDAAISIMPGSGSLHLDFYLGPIESGTLAAADPALRDLMFGALWFWLRWICFGLLWLLNAIHVVFGAALPPGLSWGLTVMGLSLAVSVLMRPLTGIADRLQNDVHAIERRLAPELNEIKRAHKGEEQAERILALYKREGIHPLYSLKSLLGVAIVIPVFIGAFDMLAENIHLLGVPFLWINDLSRPDAIATLPFELPFFGSGVNLLPFMMTGLSMVSSTLHRPASQHPDLRRKQVRNMFMLSAAFFVLFYTFPSGMVLYWTTNNLISAVKGGYRRLKSPPETTEREQDG